MARGFWPRNSPCQEHDKDGIGEQHQPFQLGRDVNQPFKVQQRGQIVADEPDHEGLPPYPCLRQSLTLRPHLPNGISPDRDVERQRECHAQRQQQSRIRLLLVSQLDEDGLGGKQRSACGRVSVALDHFAVHGATALASASRLVPLLAPHSNHATHVLGLEFDASPAFPLCP